jgi:hypothetical protein
MKHVRCAKAEAVGPVEAAVVVAADREAAVVAEAEAKGDTAEAAAVAVGAAAIIR